MHLMGWPTMLYSIDHISHLTNPKCSECYWKAAYRSKLAVEQLCQCRLPHMYAIHQYHMLRKVWREEGISSSGTVLRQQRQV